MTKISNKLYITGQQIGLLGGPLYTIYKVLGAIHYAEKNGGKAVYWLETNDADFNEINRIDYINSENELKTLKWDKSSEGFSCGKIIVDKKLVSIMEIFFDTVKQTEYTSELKESVLNCYKPGKTLGEATKSLALYLFGDFGITIFDPSSIEFRKFSKSILLNEAKRTNDGEQCNLFYMDGVRRKAVFKKGGKFVSREGEPVDIEAYDLVPSLKTRSICQDSYFSPTAYIAGPGEIKYLNKLGDYYNFHKVSPATVIPRMSIDLIEPAVYRNMKKLGLEIGEINKSDIDSMKRNVAKQLSGYDKNSIEKKALELAGSFISEMEKLGLSTGKFKKNFFRNIKALTGQKRKSEMEKISGSINKVEMIYRHLKPFGKRQERVFNIFYYLNLFGGRNFIKKLYGQYNETLSFMEIKNG